MTTRVWITRTAPGAEGSAERWAAAGFEPVIAPLLRVEPVLNRKPVPTDATLIFTSTHGVQQGPEPQGNPRVYAVGEATAEAARKKGYSDIVVGQGGWEDLLARITPTHQPIVHVGGEVVRGDLVGRLNASGFDARRVIVYRTDPVDRCSIDPAEVDIIALYSPRGAETLLSLLSERPIPLVVALSEAVATPLGDRPVWIAKRPNEEALIDAARFATREQTR